MPVCANYLLETYQSSGKLSPIDFPLHQDICCHILKDNLNQSVISTIKTQGRQHFHHEPSTILAMPSTSKFRHSNNSAYILSKTQAKTERERDIVYCFRTDKQQAPHSRPRVGVGPCRFPPVWLPQIQN